MVADNNSSQVPLLQVNNLGIELSTRTGAAPVIDDVSFELHEGETLSFVGESGCGKSMTALALMGLLPEGVSRVTQGSIIFAGEDITHASNDRLNKLRGNDISMIFQEPMTSLNPVFTIGDQIAEVLRQHQHLSNDAAMRRAEELLDQVRIPEARRRIYSYPHELSGGQRQRVMIAMALACQPKLLIADEPTTALDVTVQAQIFDLLDELQQYHNTAIMLITHDMGVVAEMAERMIVMYAGRMVEYGPVDAVLQQAQHPYTAGLIACVPHLHATITEQRDPLLEVPGVVPALSQFGRNACLFAERCDRSSDQCRQSRPNQSRFNDRRVACWHPTNDNVPTDPSNGTSHGVQP